MDPDKIKAAIEALKNQDADAALVILEEMIVAAAGGTEGAPEPAPEGEALGEVPDPPADEAALATLKKLTGSTTIAGVVTALSGMLERVQALDADRVASELSERFDLVGKLVKLGAETPATAWADPVKKVLKERLSKEPIAELRDRVKKLSDARPGAAPEIKPPASSGDPELTPSELAKAEGLTPIQLKKYKELRAKRSNRETV